MLQSMTVLLLVFTIKKGSCIVEFKAGGPWFCCSFCWFLCTKFLNAICCKKKEKKLKLRKQCFQKGELHRSYLPTLNTPSDVQSKDKLWYWSLSGMKLHPTNFYAPLARPWRWNNGAITCGENASSHLLKRCWSQRSPLLSYMHNYLRLGASYKLQHPPFLSICVLSPSHPSPFFLRQIYFEILLSTF